MSDKPDLDGTPAQDTVADSGAALRAHSVRSGVITLAAQGVKFTLQLAITATLARLLIPDDFGLVAMVVAITGLFGALKDSSLMMSIIQAPELSEQTLSTLFWINLGLSTLLMLVSFLAAPLVASLYDRPEIFKIMLVLAAFLPLSGLTTHYQGMLSRELQFSTIAIVEVSVLTTAAITAIAMAWMGLGYWSLVALIGLQPVVALAAYAGTTRWLPSLPRSTSTIRERLVFSAGLFATSTVSYVTRNLDNVLIGAQWGASALGNYSQAYRLLLLPIRQINDPLGRVLVPVLSRLRSKPQEFENYFLSAISGIAYVTVPAVAAMAALADLLVELLLGDQWTMAAPIFQALALAAAVQTFSNAIGWLYVSSGRSDRFLRITLLNAGVLIIAIVLALPAGPTAVAWAISLATLLLWVPQTIHACANQPMKPSRISLAVIPACVLGIVLVCVNYSARELLFQADAMDIRGQLLSFASACAITGTTALCWPRCRRDISRFVRILNRARSEHRLENS